MDRDKLQRLAELVRASNEINEQIAALVERPALTGHVGEWIAQEIFDIKLEHSATQAGYDGVFSSGMLAGKTVNVKWYGKRDGLIDINPSHLPDYYLVMTGPKTPATSSKGKTRPWTISEIFLFDASVLLPALQESGVLVGIASSVKAGEWDRARLYPASEDSLFKLKPEQIEMLKLFALRAEPTPDLFP